MYLHCTILIFMEHVLLIESLKMSGDPGIMRDSVIVVLIVSVIS